MSFILPTKITIKAPTKIKTIIFCIVGYFLLFAMNASAQNYDSQAKKIDSEIQRIQKEQAKQKKNKSTLLTQLNKTNKKLNSVSKELSNLNSNLNNQKSLIKKLKKNKQSKQGERINAQDSLAMLMTQHVKINKPNVIQLWLSQKNLNDIDRQQKYLAYFSKARQQQINFLRIDMQDAESSVKEYQVRERLLKKQYKEQEKIKNKIAKTTKEKAQLIKNLDSNIAKNTTTIKKLKTDRKRLSSLLARLEKQSKAKKTVQKFTPTHGGFSKQKGRMLYPVNGKVVGRFGRKSAATGLTSNGISTKASKKGDNSVRSIYDGRVIFSNWLKGFGNLIILEHGQGYMSLYGNNEVLNKKEGDVVSAREVIALYKQGSSNNSYFEIRKNGKAINPSQWLK